MHKDIKALGKPQQQKVHDLIDLLASGRRHTSTHTLQGFGGWSSTKADGRTLIVHRHDDGVLNVGFVGSQHDYEKARRRLLGAKGGISYEHQSKPLYGGDLHNLDAWDGDTNVGSMEWHSTGKGLRIAVEPTHQRRGIATEMWNRAREITPYLQHSRPSTQTEDGKAWASTTSSVHQAVMAIIAKTDDGWGSPDDQSAFLDKIKTQDYSPARKQKERRDDVELGRYHLFTRAQNEVDPSNYYKPGYRGRRAPMEHFFGGGAFRHDLAHPALQRWWHDNGGDRLSVPHYGPQKQTAVRTADDPRPLYHGTTRENLISVEPAISHGRHVTFSHDTSREHAYATHSLDDAWDYAEKAWHASDTGVPRVYRVSPRGAVEKDPIHDGQGNRRGNWEHDVRSKHGFDVVREEAMPESMGSQEDWR